MIGGFLQYRANHDTISYLGTGVIALVPLFIFRRQKTFGHWMALLTLSLVSLMSVIVHGLLTPYLVFLAFLINLVFNLNAANLLLLAGQSGLSQRISVGYFRQFLPSLCLGLAAGAIIFFLFPRTRSLNNPLGFRQRTTETGYTGKVTLDGKRPITESSALAVMIEAPDPAWLLANAADLYLRGNTLDTFDGVHWSAAASPTFPYESNANLRFSRAYRVEIKELKLYREPHSTEAILYPGLLLGLDAPWKLLRGVHYDLNANVMRGSTEVIRYAYRTLITPLTTPKSLAQITLAEVASVVRNTHDRPTVGRVVDAMLPNLLQIPDAVRDAGYFRGWIRQVGVTRNTSVAQALDLLKSHFRDRFEATLVNQFSEGIPFRSFLETDRRGHCEYFATAATLFLRSFGIPTRLVLGYRGGTFNQLSKVLEVREENAHAWVEVYVPHEGWIRYDPTPIGPPASMGGFAAYYLLYTNAAKYWFGRYVVNYDSQAQKDLVRSIAGFRAVGHFFGDRWMRPRELVTLLLALFTLTFLFWLFSRRAGDRGFRRRRLPAYYEAFLRKVSARGLSRSPGETFPRFHRRIGETGWAPELLDPLETAIQRDLYSAEPLPDAERESLRRTIRARR